MGVHGAHARQLAAATAAMAVLSLGFCMVCCVCYCCQVIAAVAGAAVLLVGITAGVLMSKKRKDDSTTVVPMGEPIEGTVIDPDFVVDGQPAAALGLHDDRGPPTYGKS